MEKEIAKIHNKDNGFTLIEVLVAMAIFAFFASVFITSQSYNLSKSGQMREEVRVKSLTQSVMDDIIENPPAFSESLTLSPETKSFEQNPEYQYTVEYKKVVMPDLSGMMGEEEQQADDGGISGIQKSLAEKIKKNLEEMIWQVRVTVVHKESNLSYSLAAWLMNDGAKVDFGLQ